MLVWQRRRALYEARGALPRRRPDGPEPDNIPAREKAVKHNDATRSRLGAAAGLDRENVTGIDYILYQYQSLLLTWTAASLRI